MRYGKIDDLETVRKKINAITAEELQTIAQEIFQEEQLSVLRYI